MKFELNDSLGYLINVVSAKFKTELHHRLSPYDITTEQWAMLARLWEGQGKTQKELAEKTGKDEPNAGRILKKLEAKGLIIRKSDAQDRRIMLVFLTEQGIGLEEKLVPLANDILKRVEQELNNNEIETLKILLKKLMGNW